jgi:hypothetical protein
VRRTWMGQKRVWSSPGTLEPSPSIGLVPSPRLAHHAWQAQIAGTSPAPSAPHGPASTGFQIRPPLSRSVTLPGSPERAREVAEPATGAGLLPSSPEQVSESSRVPPKGQIGIRPVAGAGGRLRGQVRPPCRACLYHYLPPGNGPVTSEYTGTAVSMLGALPGQAPARVRRAWVQTGLRRWLWSARQFALLFFSSER